MSKRKKARERDDTATTVPLPSAPTPRKNDYLTKVYQSLQQFGATQPGPMVDASGDYWKTCQLLHIAPEVCAANIYSAERHRHHVTSTTINEAKEDAEEASDKKTERAELKKLFKAADDADTAAKAAPSYETHKRAEDAARAAYNAASRFYLTYGTQSVHDDGQVYASYTRYHEMKRTQLAGAREEGDPSAMGSNDESKQPEPAASEMPRGPGGVQSQIAAKKEAECETCIPWRKVSRDPAEHAEITALKKMLDSPLDVYAVVGPDLNRETQEVFLVLPVNVHGHLMGPAYEIARGQRDRVAVGIDNVMDAASDARCAGFIVCHNHPGGSPRPSKADMQLTDEIRKATPPGRRFLDHVIIGPDLAYSCVGRKLYKVKK